MKKLSMISAILLVISSVCLKAQDIQPKLSQIDQLKAMDQFVGTWEGKTGEETSQIWEFIKKGKSVYANLYGVKQNVKTVGTMFCYGYDPNSNKIKGYSLHASGNYSTWLMTFKSENICCVETTKDWDPETIGVTYDCIFDDKNSWRMISYNKEGAKTSETKFVRLNP